MNRELTLTEFQNLAINILNLNNSLAEVEQKFHEIDKDKNGKLSTREFVDYFLTDLANNEERFKEDYLNFGLNTDRNSFEHGLLLYEAMDGLKSQSNSVGRDTYLNLNPVFTLRLVKWTFTYQNGKNSG